MQQSIMSQDIKEETESFLNKTFGEKVTYNFSKYHLPANVKSEIEKKVRQRFFGDFVYLYDIKVNETKKFYALMDNVYGKSMPITFIVIFDSTSNIISSGIIKYREQYGGGVSDENWNRQFQNKSSQSGYEVGKDIQSISGATISVNSVTKGIQKLSLLMKTIIDKK